MPQAIIISCLVIVVLTYALFSLRVGNFINVLTPFLLFEIPAHYVLELVDIAVFGRSGSDYAYFYCYATYTLGILATALGYLGMTARPVSVVLTAPTLRVPALPVLLLLVGAGLYAPVLLAYPHLLASPREIYSLTRSGFGIFFFLSSFAVYIGYILFLFSGKHGRVAHLSYFLAACLILYMHGSKGQVLQLFLISLFYFTFVQRKRFGIGKVMLIGPTAALGILGLFYLITPADSAVELISNVAAYSDYTRNSMLVIDDPHLVLQHGQLTAGEMIYSLVPRAVFPDKPTDFGSLWLAEQYFPKRFAANTGAPAFGIGVPYADFGDFAIVYWTLASLLAGATMRLLTSKLRIAPDAGTFALLLVFLNVQLIPAGAAIPLIFYYVCAIGVRIFAGRPPVLEPVRALDS